MPGNFFSGQLDPGSAGNIALDNGADSGCGLVRERIYLVFLHFDNAHNVVPLDGDVIGSTVLVAVNGDQ